MEQDKRTNATNYVAIGSQSAYFTQKPQAISNRSY